MSRQRYKPMLAKEAKVPFTDANWIFEVKWDGFRAIAYLDGTLSLRSRNQKELLGDFPELKELEQLAHGVVIDGEIVVLNEGKVDFQALLERRKAIPSTGIALKTDQPTAVYVVFDILEKDGMPLLDLPLMKRKKILKESVKEGEHVLLLEYVEEKGNAYYQAVLQKGLEGVIAKQKSSLYEAGVRSGSWLKFKKLLSCDCVIFGYTEGVGNRKKTFGALLLGLYNSEGVPVYIGKVGTGFSEAILKSLLGVFQKIRTDAAPFGVSVFGEVIWLKPKLVCEVNYQNVTKDGRLRISRFLRLRTDKKPRDCIVDQLTEKRPFQEYKSKRDFSKTTEPKGEEKKFNKREKIFVVQEHHARRLHYDFRLERGGVLKSWAVPKGIPESPESKRLAVETEDHPIDYAQFEGEIPEGQYGAGRVVIWDKGTFETKVWDEKMVEVILKGQRLKGRFVLVPLKKAGVKNWLMLKAKD